MVDRMDHPSGKQLGPGLATISRCTWCGTSSDSFCATMTHQQVQDVCQCNAITAHNFGYDGGDGASRADLELADAGFIKAGHLPIGGHRRDECRLPINRGSPEVSH